MRKIVFIIAFISVFFAAQAQIHVCPFSEHVRTLRVIYQTDMTEEGQTYASRPFLKLVEGKVDGSDAANTLHISFDEMSHDLRQYSYTVTHMKADWSGESGLSTTEYLKGFTTQDIVYYEHSINTTREYTHYEFLFPNEEMILTCSGNYKLLIYEDGDRDKRVAEIQFCVVEPLTTVQANVRSNTDIELNGRYQQVDFDVRMTAIRYNDPNEIKIVVRQNNRSDNEVWLKQPTFIEPGRLRYQNQKALIFEGGNEYHHFDPFSAYYAGVGIDRVFFQNGDYHVMLFPDEMTRGQYIHQFDSDGRFIVNAERTKDSEIEAEYMWAHWVLPAEKPWLDGALYIGGDLFGNELKLTNRMQYDVENKCYWLTTLVKQGGYDYQYWFCGKGTQNKTTTQRVDGSYWQTENEYAIYIYWRPFGARYDRLVGLLTLKSEL